MSFIPFNNKRYDEPEVSFVGKIDDFFKDTDIEPRIELEKKKENLINFLSNKEQNEKLNDFKKKLLIKRLNLFFLYIEYFEYFEKRFGKKTYRYIGKDLDEDMKNDILSAKASKMDNLFNNYGFDGGYVEYWSFSNGLVFRTIKRLKII